MVHLDKKKIEIDGREYEIPEIVLNTMKKMEKDNIQMSEFTEELKRYIYNSLGTNAKA